LNDLDVAHPTYFAAKTYLKIDFQIAFTIKLRTSGVQIIQRKQHKKHFCFKSKNQNMLIMRKISARYERLKQN